PEIRTHVLEERHGEMPALLRPGVDQRRRGGTDEQLAGESHATGHPLRAAPAHLGPVVEETDQAVQERHPECDPDVDLSHVRQEQGRDGEREEDQYPAHGRRAALALVRGGTVLADRLPDLQGRQPADHGRPEEQRQAERHEPGHQRAERDVLEDVERRPVGAKIVQEHGEHHASPPPTRSRSTDSSAAPREAFRSTRSPARHSTFSRSAASPWSAATVIRSAGMPAALAPRRTRPPRDPTTTRPSSPAAAAVRPSSSCAASVSSPSSRISPSTARRRSAALAASVWSAAAIDAGFAL